MSTLKIPMYQVDAFAGHVFSGNPAAICPLESWLPDGQMQSIAAENNLAETAFFVRNGKGYKLRWFTPGVEVDLCGHATLATASVILNDLTPGERSVSFETKSGTLTVTRDGDLYSMDFPARPPEPCANVYPGLVPALGRPAGSGAGGARLLRGVRHGRRAPGAEARHAGADEIGSFRCDRHRARPRSSILFRASLRRPKACPKIRSPARPIASLIPYWSKRLGKKKLHAYQVSPRGGELWCEDRGERVTISGKTVRFFEGTIFL